MIYFCFFSQQAFCFLVVGGAACVVFPAPRAAIDPRASFVNPRDFFLASCFFFRSFFLGTFHLSKFPPQSLFFLLWDCFGADQQPLSFFPRFRPYSRLACKFFFPTLFPLNFFFDGSSIFEVSPSFFNPRSRDGFPFTSFFEDFSDRALVWNHVRLFFFFLFYLYEVSRLGTPEATALTLSLPKIPFSYFSCRLDVVPNKFFSSPPLT